MTQDNSQYYNQSQSLEDFDQAQTDDKPNVQQQLEELEAQVYQTTKENINQETETESSFVESIKEGIKTMGNWFNSLPQVGKLIVGIVAILIGFNILNLFLHLIANLITLAILGLILYGLYKYLFSNS